MPLGQDPAAVLGSLRVHGVSARHAVLAGEPTIVIALDTPGGRQRVREILRDAPLNVQGDPSEIDTVTFSDEALRGTGNG